ncbi:DNA (cytosine-5-)-methyltransferase, partial [bacterium]|nr:DNA (cytosine-5-)-methyltransferase [bacterium]
MGTVRQLVNSIRPEQEPASGYQEIETSIDSDVLEYAKRIHANKPRVTNDLLKYHNFSKRSIKRIRKRMNKRARKLIVSRNEPDSDDANFDSTTPSVILAQELGRPIAVIAASTASTPLQARIRISKFSQVFPQDGGLLSLEETIDRAVYKIQNQPVSPINPSIKGTPSSPSPKSKRVSAHAEQTPTQRLGDKMIAHPSRRCGGLRRRKRFAKLSHFGVPSGKRKTRVKRGKKSTSQDFTPEAWRELDACIDLFLELQCDSLDVDQCSNEPSDPESELPPLAVESGEGEEEPIKFSDCDSDASWKSDTEDPSGSDPEHPLVSSSSDGRGEHPAEAEESSDEESSKDDFEQFRLFEEFKRRFCKNAAVNQQIERERAEPSASSSQASSGEAKARAHMAYADPTTWSPNWTPPEFPRLKVGTDCSGMDTPYLAFENLEVPCEPVFACDNDKYAEATIRNNSNPKHYYSDIEKRNNEEAPAVDVYIVGFPCQPFSRAGKQEGFDDSKGRGKVFFNILDYIQQKLPKIFILENVKGFTTIDKGKCLRRVMKDLHSITMQNPNHGEYPNYSENKRIPAYAVHSQIINTLDHGIPHNRPRWYCVGIRQDVRNGYHPFQFPASIPCAPLQMFLDGEKTPLATQFDQASATCQKNVNEARRIITSTGKDPDNNVYVIDCDASDRKLSYIQGISPCITRSRNKGHWLTKHNRYMSLEEIYRLQGVDIAKFKTVVPRAEQGKLLGNAMSVNVLERLLRNVLLSTTLPQRSVLGPDRWQQGRAQKLLYARKSLRIQEPIPQAKKPFPFGPNEATCRELGGGLSASSASRGSKPRRLLIDSGATFHLVSLKDLTPTERKTIRPLAEPVKIHTANGDVLIALQAQIYIIDLRCYVWAHCLENTVAVLSLGNLVDEHGFDYIWRSRQTPYLLKDNIKVYCPVSANVPYCIPAALGAPAEQEASSSNALPPSQESWQPMPGSISQDMPSSQESVPPSQKSKRGGSRKSGGRKDPGSEILEDLDDYDPAELPDPEPSRDSGKVDARSDADEELLPDEFEMDEIESAPPPPKVSKRQITTARKRKLRKK